jgi:hypothetical protein
VRKYLLVAAVGTMALTSSVQAAPIDVLPGNPDLAIYQKDFPLLPAETTVYLIDSFGTTIWGSLADNSTSQDVKFQSSEVVDASNGNANIQYGKDDTNKQFQDLTITLPSLQFGDILFDTQKADSFTVSVFSDAFSLLDPFGFYTFTGLGNGAQSFAILATGQYAITKVLLEAIAPEGFSEIKHIKFSEIQPNTGGCRPGPCDTDVEPIPIPPALPLLGGALVMLGWLARSKRKLLG